MTRRHKIWLALAILFTLVNLGGGVIAAVRGQLLHTGIHAVLVLLGEYVVWRLRPRRVANY